MDLVDKVGGVGDTHERRSGIDLVHPGVELLVVLTRKEVASVLGDELEAVCLQIGARHGGDVLEEDQDDGLGRRLVRHSAYVRTIKEKERGREGKKEKQQRVVYS